MPGHLDFFHESTLSSSSLRAALISCFTQPLLVLETASIQLPDLALGLVELQEVCTDPQLKPKSLWMESHPSSIELWFVFSSQKQRPCPAMEVSTKPREPSLASPLPVSGDMPWRLGKNQSNIPQYIMSPGWQRPRALHPQAASTTPFTSRAPSTHISQRSGVRQHNQRVTDIHLT